MEGRAKRMAEKLENPFKLGPFQNIVDVDKKYTERMRGHGYDETYERTYSYDGTEQCRDPTGYFNGARYVKSMGGGCGDSDFHLPGEKWNSKNRRLGCVDGTTATYNSTDFRPYDKLPVLDQVVECKIPRFLGGDDELTCMPPNPDTCPALKDEMGETIIEPRTKQNVEWETKVRPPISCPNDSDGDCGSNDCEYLKNLQPGGVMCTYAALDTLERVKAFRTAFGDSRNAHRGDVKRVMDAYCGTVLRPTEFTDAQKRLYGDDFQCNEITGGGGARAHQCTAYMGEGAAANVCWAHMNGEEKHGQRFDANYPVWSEQRKNLMTKICDQFDVCRETQNDDQCLHECACVRRAKHESYPRGEKAMNGAPDKCWWKYCDNITTDELGERMLTTKHRVWKGDDQQFGPDGIEECPNICIVVGSVKDATAEEVQILVENDCEVDDMRIVDPDKPDKPDEGGGEGGGGETTHNETVEKIRKTVSANTELAIGIGGFVVVVVVVAFAAAQWKPTPSK